MYASWLPYSLSSLLTLSSPGGLAIGIVSFCLLYTLGFLNGTVRYDYLKTLLLRRPVPIINIQLRDNLFLHVVASCLAGTIATSKLLLPIHPRVYVLIITCTSRLLAC